MCLDHTTNDIDSYPALYPVNIYELVRLYIDQFHIHMTIQKAQIYHPLHIWLYWSCHASQFHEILCRPKRRLQSFLYFGISSCAVWLLTRVLVLLLFFCFCQMLGVGVGGGGGGEREREVRIAINYCYYCFCALLRRYTLIETRFTCVICIYIYIIYSLFQLYI